MYFVVGMPSAPVVFCYKWWGWWGWRQDVVRANEVQKKAAGRGETGRKSTRVRYAGWVGGLAGWSIPQSLRTIRHLRKSELPASGIHKRLVSLKDGGIDAIWRTHTQQQWHMGKESLIPGSNNNLQRLIVHRAQFFRQYTTCTV